MAIPSYIEFIDPVLRYLAQHPQGVAAQQVHEAAADAMGLSAEERAELLPSQSNLVYKNRIGWAHDRLKRAGLSSSIERGVWCLTPAGFQFAAEHPQALSGLEANGLAISYTQVKLRENENLGVVEKQVAEECEPSYSLSPEERLEQALSEIRARVAADVLEALAKVHPNHFESIVLDVLHTLGYGTQRSDLQRVGGSGDGGIDGVISLDKLGLEKVYVQAKRWQGSVGRPEIQAFYGALAGQRARKGVFITTSSYTAQAQEFARSVEGIVLIDGQRLAELMVDHEVGASARVLKLPRFDSDYFDI